MNTLKLKLNPYKDINIASLDEKPLSPYSELSNFLKEPFLKWAGSLLETAEREINDDYRLIVTAEEFETRILRDMQNDFDSCLEFKTDRFQLAFTVDERYRFVTGLLQKYGIAYSLRNHVMPFYTDIRVSPDQSMTEPADIDNAFLIITDNKYVLSRVKRKNGAAIVVFVSDHSAATNIGDMKYLWEIEEGRLQSILNCITDRFVKVPFILGAVKKLKETVDVFEESDAEKLAMATEIDMFITVADVENIEVGKSASLKFRTVPEGGDIPKLRITTSNPGIIRVEGLTLTAAAPGKAYIEVYRAEEILPFARKNVVAFRDNLVQQISLDIKASRMGISKTQNIGIQCVPADAEDAHSVRWVSSRNDVASVDNAGNVTAIAPGAAVITAFTSKASKSVSVSVLPNITSIKPSVSDCHLYVGKTQPVSVSIAPADCFDRSYSWRTSDRKVAIIERLEDGSTVIRATGIGSCTLTCAAKEGGCSASCSVVVDSTFNRKEYKKKTLGAALGCFIAALICACSKFAVGAAAAAVATAVCGKKAIEDDKADRFWAYLLMGGAVIVALASFFIK